MRYRDERRASNKPKWSGSLHAGGVSPAYLQEQLGHSSI
jgi:hypothetical protein